MLTQRDCERLVEMRLITVRYGTDGADTPARLQRGEYQFEGKDSPWGSFELSFTGEDDRVFNRRFAIDQLSLVGDVLVILPTEVKLAETPLKQWLENERRAQVQYLRELAYDISVTTPRGILEAGIGMNCHEPHLAAALAKEEWVKVEWTSKPGWRVTKARSEFYVTEAEVERVLGFPLPKKGA